MKNQKYSNLDALTIIVAAWNLGMADANAICAKADHKPDQALADLASFIVGENVPLSDIFKPEDTYADQCIEYYTIYKRLSEMVTYTKWKSLKRNSLVKTYGMMFDMYLRSNFNTYFLNHMPFFKMSERQFAKLFIKMRNEL